MYHEHPLKIIKNAAKNIWLLVFPLLRGIRTFTLDFNAFYTWIKGAWFDILVILFILGFGYFRWLFTWFRFEKNNVCLISGIFVNKEIIIPYKNISAVTAEHSFFLRPFKAAKVSVDTCAGSFGTSDMSLLIRREDLKMLRRKLPEVHKEGKKTFEFKPKWFTIVFFSFVFSNSLSGIVYLSTFLFQSGRIIKDLLETELVEFIKLANGVSAKLALKIPPAAIILGFLVIITWLFSFAANILRYAGFIMKKDKNILKIKMGTLTKRIYHIVPDKINYVDLRQSLIMKLFKTSTVNISCSGYGNQKNELPVLLPILTRQQANRALDLLDFKKYITKRKVRVSRLAFITYTGTPAVFILLIPVVAALLIWLFPTVYDIIIFISIMAEIPFVWLFIIKIVALYTSGITIEDNFCCIRYSRFYAFHTILADKDKLIKIQIVQNPFDKKLGRCRLDFYFNTEVPRNNKVKGVRIQDAKRILEKFEFS